MKYAIFSDIHNNDHALSKMLQDAARRNIDTYLCLGDVGTDPNIQLVRNVGAETVFGNWEVSGWQYLSPTYQKQTLNLPPIRKYDGFWITHAAPTWPDHITTLQQFLKNRHRLGMASVFPYYVSESNALWQAFAELLSAKIPLLFHGHTHQQAAWVLNSDNHLQKTRSEVMELDPKNTYIIGVGSVGQPKDSAKPSYVVFDTDSMQMEFIRVG
jgi:predicted phosphodiesterase